MCESQFGCGIAHNLTRNRTQEFAEKILIFSQTHDKMNHMKKYLRQTNVNLHRYAWLEINLENLAQNIKEIRKGIPDSKKILAIVKADAYGHGAVMLAKTMAASGVEMFGVASVDEGIDLREGGIKEPILVVGAAPVWAFETAAKNDIAISIFNQSHIDSCKEVYERCGLKTKVHVKIDTGMNRIGVRDSWQLIT